MECYSSSNQLPISNSLVSIRKMFEVNFAEKGSNARKREEAAYMMFNDYLQEIEGIINYS